MPLIVIEGPDGAGKTTLIKEIAEAFDGDTVEVVHFGPPKFDPRDPRTAGEQSYDEMMKNEVIESYDPSSGKVLILDRFHMGCPVYGPVYRPELDLHEGYGEMTAEQYGRIDTWIRSNGGATYVIIPPVDLIFERVSKDGDDYVTEKGTALRARLETFANRYAQLTAATPSANVIQHSETPEETMIMADYISADTILRQIRLDRSKAAQDKLATAMLSDEEIDAHVIASGAEPIEGF